MKSNHEPADKRAGLQTETPSRTATARRGRRRAPEAFADWMARIDSQVESEYRRVCKAPPMARLLSANQRRIVEMLAEHLRSLPALKDGEDFYKKPEYNIINRLLVEVFLAKYPQWTQTTETGSRYVGALPNGEGKVFERLLRNCAGRAPEERERQIGSDDDD